MRKIASTGSLEERVRRLEQARNFDEFLLAFTAVGDEVTTTGGGGGGSEALQAEVPSGTVDGVNDTFTVSAVPAGIFLLWKNGLVQRAGSGNDFTRSGATVVFEAGNVPQAGANLLAAFAIPGTATLSFEVLAGTIDGVNDTFTIPTTPTTMAVVFKNGMAQLEGSGNDYTRSGATVVFEAGNLPQTGDNLLALHD